MKKKEKVQEVDIEELIKKIDARIKELGGTSQEETPIDSTDYDLDEIIKEIDRKIMALEKDDNLDIDKLNHKINCQIDETTDCDDEKLDKTIYDLKEISKNVDSTIKELEKKKKEKKRKKAMYCDMARKREKQKKKK